MSQQIKPLRTTIVIGFLVVVSILGIVTLTAFVTHDLITDQYEKACAVQRLNPYDFEK